VARTPYPRGLASLAVAAAVAGAPIAASAQPKPDPGADRAKKDLKKTAKVYVDAGIAAQDRGDYDAAYEFYRKAYELLPHPTLLFNMGQALRLGGRKQEALDQYQKFLAQSPKGQLAAEAIEWVGVLNRQLADERAVDAAKPKPKPVEPKPAEPKPVEPKPAEPPPPPPPQPIAQPEVQAGAGGGLGGVQLAGIGTAIAGVAAIGLGGYFGVRAKSLSDELSKPGTTYDPDKYADGEAAERNMYISYGVGAALVAGGAVLYVLGHRGGESAPEGDVSLVPTFGAGLGVGLAGTF